MLGLYIPLLMSLLLREEEEGAASSLMRTQHELVLAKLTAIAAQFPLDFKVPAKAVYLWGNPPSCLRKCLRIFTF